MATHSCSQGVNLTRLGRRRQNMRPGGRCLPGQRPEKRNVDFKKLRKNKEI